MAFSFQVSGMDELNSRMEKLGGEALHIAAEGLYEGAGVVADAVSSAVNGIATEKFKYAAGGKKRKPSPEEKALLSSAKKGVAKFRNNVTSTIKPNKPYAKIINTITATKPTTEATTPS